jgi:hypothetical protein
MNSATYLSNGNPGVGGRYGKTRHVLPRDQGAPPSHYHLNPKKECQVLSGIHYNFPKGYSLMNFVYGRKGVKVNNTFHMQPINLGLKDEDDNQVFCFG